jgi:hypothetical protein
MALSETARENGQELIVVFGSCAFTSATPGGACSAS